MTSRRLAAAIFALTSLAALVGCPGKSSTSRTAHDVPYYNTHPQERQATLDRCDALDQAAQNSDADCKAAVYSSLYGPSQLRTNATTSPR
jgi:hypothetical protein